MKKISLAPFLFIITILLLSHTTQAQTKSTSTLFRHTVIITFKQDAPADSIQALDKIYKELSKSSMVKDYEWGSNVSSRDSSVMMHIYVTTFASKQDMAAYRKIPVYARLFPISLAISDAVNVVDYWVEK